MDQHSYSVYGLRVDSALPLPPLAPTIDSRPADITITIGAVDRPSNPATDDDGFIVRDSTILLDVPGTAMFEARGGREIVVSPAPQSEVAAIRLYLLGSLMGVILHQRGLLPIHASAVRLGEQAVAFAADSGGGKSTLAALLYRRGYEVICDDVGALELGPEGIFLSPGVPRIRLTTEALIALGEETASLESRSRSVDKREMPLEHSQGTAAHRSELKRLYVLSYHDAAVSIERLDEWHAFLELRRNIYRPALIRSLVKERDFLHLARDLVPAVDVFRLSRSRDVKQLEVVVDALEVHLADLAESPGTLV